MGLRFRLARDDVTDAASDLMLSLSESSGLVLVLIVLSDFVARRAPFAIFSVNTFDFSIT